MTREECDMQAALIADGENLTARTGEDHGPVFVDDAIWIDGTPICPVCGEILSQEDQDFDDCATCGRDPDWLDDQEDDFSQDNWGDPPPAGTEG